MKNMTHIVAVAILALAMIGCGEKEPLSLSINDVLLPEGESGNTDFVFVVLLSRVAEADVSVNWQTMDGTATAPTDYTAASGTLTIPARDRTGIIKVSVKGDSTYEADETFQVKLTLSTNSLGVQIADDIGIGTIQNDDPEITLSICSGVQHPEGDSGTTPFVFTVTLSKVCATDVSVDWTTVDYTATAPCLSSTSLVQGVDEN
jgi:hypothetical protein